MKFSQKMPLYFVYTIVQKSQKWPKTQIKGGSCLKHASQKHAHSQSACNWLTHLIKSSSLANSLKVHTASCWALPKRRHPFRVLLPLYSAMGLCSFQVWDASQGQSSLVSVSWFPIVVFLLIIAGQNRSPFSGWSWCQSLSSFSTSETIRWHSSESWSSFSPRYWWRSPSTSWCFS